MSAIDLAPYVVALIMAISGLSCFVGAGCAQLGRIRGELERLADRE